MPNRSMVIINCVLILMVPLILADDIHRFGLYCPQTINIDVMREIRNGFFPGQLVLDHPPCLILHGKDERLV